MHLRNHLEVVILDHGPVTAFRVLALNDLMNSMGNERTNKRPVELQILKEFSSAKFQKDMKSPCKKNFKEIFLNFVQMKKIFPQMIKIFPLPTAGRSMTFLTLQQTHRYVE